MAYGEDDTITNGARICAELTDLAETSEFSGVIAIEQDGEPVVELAGRMHALVKVEPLGPDGVTGVFGGRPGA